MADVVPSHRRPERRSDAFGRGHGGPGCTHDYVLALAQLAERGRPVVHYDQLGGGRSTHMPEKGGDFWTVELFLEELENLLVYLGLNDRYSCSAVVGWDARCRTRHSSTRGFEGPRHQQLTGLDGALG